MEALTKSGKKVEVKIIGDRFFYLNGKLVDDLNRMVLSAEIVNALEKAKDRLYDMPLFEDGKITACYADWTVKQEAVRVLTNEEFNLCLSEAYNYSDADAYVSDMARSSIWRDEESEFVPTERIEALRSIYTAAHRTLADISADSGLNLRQLYLRFGIPERTMYSWSKGEREPAPYLLTLMQDALGLIKR